MEISEILESILFFVTDKTHASCVNSNWLEICNKFTVPLNNSIDVYNCFKNKDSLSLKRSEIIDIEWFGLACKYGLLDIVKFLLPNIEKEYNITFPLIYVSVMYNKLPAYISKSVYKALKYGHIHIINKLLFKSLNKDMYVAILKSGDINIYNYSKKYNLYINANKITPSLIDYTDSIGYGGNLQIINDLIFEMNLLKLNQPENIRITKLLYIELLHAGHSDIFLNLIRDECFNISLSSKELLLYNIIPNKEILTSIFEYIRSAKDIKDLNYIKDNFSKTILIIRRYLDTYFDNIFIDLAITHSINNNITSPQNLIYLLGYSLNISKLKVKNINNFYIYEDLINQYFLKNIDQYIYDAIEHDNSFFLNYYKKFIFEGNSIKKCFIKKCFLHNANKCIDLLLNDKTFKDSFNIIEYYTIDTNIILYYASKYCRIKWVNYAINKQANNNDKAISSFSWYKKSYFPIIKLLLSTYNNFDYNIIINKVIHIIDNESILLSDILDILFKYQNYYVINNHLLNILLLYASNREVNSKIFDILLEKGATNILECFKIIMSNKCDGECYRIMWKYIIKNNLI